MGVPHYTLSLLSWSYECGQHNGYPCDISADTIARQAQNVRLYAAALPSTVLRAQLW